MANSIGWGEGAKNNSISWGKASDNSISFGSVYPDSYTGETDIIGGGVTTIFGLDFDGIDDYMQANTDISLSGDAWEEYTLYQIDPITNGASNLTGRFAGNQTVFGTTDLNVRIGATDLLFPYASFSNLSFPFKGVLRIERSGTNITVSFGSDSVTLPESNSGNLQRRYIMAFSAGADFTTGVLGQYENSDGLIANTANGWTGFTVNGATESDSTDGGDNWSPV